MKALMGTPLGFSHSGSMQGHWLAGAVKRELGWAALRPQSGVHFWRCQSRASAGGGPSMPSHQTSPSGVRATLVKMVLARMLSTALGLEARDVPGATPKNPVSGLMA